MRWDTVILNAIVPTLEADSALIAELGASNRIWPAEESRPIQYDSIEWLVVSDVEEEIYNRLVIQFDVRMSRNSTAPALLRAARVERRIRRLLTRPDAVRLNDIWLNARFQEARTMPVPERDVAHRQIDILFEPLRERYTAPSLA